MGQGDSIREDRGDSIRSDSERVVRIWHGKDGAMVEISLSILLLAGAFALIMVGIAISKMYWQPKKEESETIVKGFESDADERTQKQIANVLNYGKPGYKQQEIDNDED